MTLKTSFLVLEVEALILYFWCPCRCHTSTSLVWLLMTLLDFSLASLQIHFISMWCIKPVFHFPSLLSSYTHWQFWQHWNIVFFSFYVSFLVLFAISPIFTSIFIGYLHLQVSNSASKISFPLTLFFCDSLLHTRNIKALTAVEYWIAGDPSGSHLACRISHAWEFKYCSRQTFSFKTISNRVVLS